MHRLRTPPIAPWLGIGGEALALWTDMAMVMGLRAAKMAAGGPAAQREIALMVSEKLQAAAEIQAAAVSGALGRDMAVATSRAMAIYAPKVLANRRRLTGSRPGG